MLRHNGSGKWVESCVMCRKPGGLRTPEMNRLLEVEVDFLLVLLTG